MASAYDNILSLAPDPGTADRAKSVAFARRWLSLQGNGRAIWGTLGNPADPFRTKVDLQGPAFHCTCPVRRQPCKHGIALLLLFSKNNDAFQPVSQPPDWVSEWLDKRDQREVAPTAEDQRTAKPAADPAAEDRRRALREKRLTQMAEGLARLENWLLDLLRQGLASLEGAADTPWNELSARLVDAKLGTLARRVRQIPQLIGKDNWPEKVTAELGDIYLLVRAFQRLEQLPDALQADLLGMAGVNLKKEEVLGSQPAVADRWLVAGQTQQAEDDNLLSRRTWLIGENSQRVAMLLDFSWRGQGFDTQWKPGSVLSGELVYYPAASPLRALMKSCSPSNEAFELKLGYASLQEFARCHAEALSANPWTSPFPAYLLQMVPVFEGGRFFLVDRERKMLPLQEGHDEDHWGLIAVSTGTPLDAFGVWEENVFLPLSCVAAGRFFLIHQAGREREEVIG